MSVQFEDFSLTVPPIERRSSERFRFGVLMPATLGRGDALILDISAEGARVMHFIAHPRGSHVRLIFTYGNRRFAATGRVLASRVVGLGNGPGGATSYESRLQFIDPPENASEMLRRIIQQIENERLRTWVSNASGEEPSHNREQDAGGYFMRCRLRGRNHWTKCWTRDSAQPADGFTVPAKLSEHEVEALCDAYAAMDDAGRALLRATSAVTN